ncbi:flagellar hook-associated protein [Salipiger pallidus]|uniref:Flagellar hook-associated protein 1 n=1 Tax=Salipiger pallidus TaxID=1775170 RepID=A0A8J3EGT5_9RHOB|nr:flagellar hook-associated protein FlgK [Salipiger pallidus]GGG78756.1 flagellar hook-associated protein [Salipiger pallidus]
MALSGALSNALSGLTANSRAAALIASNISNATTEGYGQRSLVLGARGGSGGVQVIGVSRNVDQAVLADRRLSDSHTGYANDMQAFSSRVEKLLGASGEPGSLTTHFAAFENALLTAASDPSSMQRLQQVAFKAQDFTDKLNVVSDHIQAERGSADRSIASQVETVNTALGRIRQLNEAIKDSSVRDGDPSSLMDERQKVIDSISGIVPVRTISREFGEVAVHTASGVPLLDSMINSEPAVIGFTAANAVTADLTMIGGDLSGLTINGRPINSSNEGPLGGGTLGAQLQVRDVAAVDMQAVLDGLARDFLERFAAGGPDSTVGAGDPGLFTDAGSAFATTDEVGLAGRISLNSLVDPSGTGAWRIRDGLGAASQGAVGDATLMQGYTDALESLVPPSSANLGTSATSFSEHVSDFVSAVAAARVRADGEQSFSSAQNTALKELELSKGVDTDAELQTLLRIEQQYAANARVMSAVDELMQTLMNI